MRRHWGAVALLVLAGALAFAGAIYVFTWFVNNAQSSGMVPSSLGLWTMSNLVTFTLYWVFWELVLIGIPGAVIAIAFRQWWKTLPYEERTGRHFGRRSRSTGGGVSLLFFIAFCIKILLDGKWNAPIATFSLNYVADSIVTILMWALLVFGIPIAIGLTWWLRREMKRP